MNLNFNSIEIINFLSIRKAIVNFNDQGIVLIEGINNDTSPVQSNGSGKSSVFDAILWTLYGETLRGASEVHNINTQEGTCCTLDFDYNSTNYKLVRYRQDFSHKNDFLIYKDSELIYNTIKKSQDFINNLLSVSSAKVLGSIILLGQGLPYKFSGLSQTARKDMLEELTGSTEYINELQNKLVIKKSYCESTIKDLNNSLYSKMGSRDSFNVMLNNLIHEKESKRSKEEIEKEISECNDEISDIDKAIESYVLSINNLNSSLETYRKVQLNASNFEYNLKNEINSLKSSINNTSTKCPTCGREYDSVDDIIKHKEELYNILAEKESQLPAISEKLKKCIETTNSLQDSLNKNNSGYQKLNIDKNILLSKIESLNSELSRLDNDDTKIDSINDSIKSLDIEINDLNNKLEKEQFYLNHINWISREVSRDFKGVLLTDSIDLLSERVSHYSEYLLDDTVTIFLDGNKLCINLNNIPYENLSGGERQRVDLSIQFALRDLLYISTGFSSNILVLDEIFDNLDVQGCERLSNLIASEFSTISSIYIVTHHTDFNIIYDKKIVIAKTGGISAVNSLE